jgi:hypothetical protein
MSYANECWRAVKRLAKRSSGPAGRRVIGGLLWVGFGVVAVGLRAQCPATLSLGNTTITSGSTTYEATSTITASPSSNPGFVVSTSASVTLVAGTQITLLPGFQATTGTASQTFVAEIATPTGCGPTLAPTSASVGSVGGTGSITVTASPGTTWTATSSQSWLVITSGASGTANGTVNYTVNPNIGVQRTATITVNGQVFTETQNAPNPSLLPATVSVSPANGTGVGYAFTYVASDPNGYEYIAEVAASFDLTNNNVPYYCHVYVIPSTNQGWVYDDAHSRSYGPVTLGSSGTATYGGCTLSGTGSSFTGSGTTLTVTVNITSFPSGMWGGTASNQMAVEDWANPENVTPWATLGYWTVSSSAGPESVSTPNPPTGPGGLPPQTYLPCQAASTGTFTSHGGSVDNWGNTVQYLMNWGANNGQTMLINTTQAPYCWQTPAIYQVTVQGLSASNPSVMSSPSSPLPVTVGVIAGLSQTSNSGSSTTFRVTASDYAGITASTANVYLLIDGSSPNVPSECMVWFQPSSGSISLAQDGATNSNYTWVSTQSIGPNGTTMSNSQCTVDAKDTTITNAGTYTETINIPITFKPAFVSSTAKTVYVDVKDGATPAQDTSWEPLGSFTVTSSGSTATVTSSPSGLSLQIDGLACTTPCTTTAAQHTLTIPNLTQAGGTGVQYVFADWQDGTTTLPKTVTLSAGGSFAAQFTTQYLLTTSASPSADGSITPASGWYNSGQVVSVTATATGGNQFSGFSGGTLSGTTSPQNVTMNGPVTVVANFGAPPPPTTTVREYIRLGGRVIAVENTTK